MVANNVHRDEWEGAMVEYFILRVRYSANLFSSYAHLYPRTGIVLM